VAVWGGGGETTFQTAALPMMTGDFSAGRACRVPAVDGPVTSRDGLMTEPCRRVKGTPHSVQ
jgi:hypothetical protein